MPAYDFFAPYCRVALTRKDGARLPLWFGSDSLKDADKFLYADAPQVGGLGNNLAIVSNVEIEQGLGNFFTVSVSCSPTFEDAMALFESDAIVTGETFLEVQYGYIANGGKLATRIFVGLLTDPDFNIGQEITVTLKAQCTCAASMYGSTTISGEQASQKKSRREWIELVAKGKGAPERNVFVDFKGVTGTRELELLAEEIPLELAGKNDNIVLRDLVEQCMCEVYYTPDPKTPANPILKIIDRHTRFGGSGNKIFQLYGFGQRNTRSLGGDLNEGGVYPILEVSTQSKQVFIRGVISGTTKTKVDDTKKKAPEIKTTQAADGGTDVLAPDGSPKQQGAKGPKPGKNTPSKKDAGGVTQGGTLVQLGDESFPTQKASNEAQEFTQFIDSGVQLSVGSVGVPDLEPGAIVEVQGLGKRFSGKYSILKVMHSIGDNGYTTRWDGINNAGYLYASAESLKDKVKAIVAAREAEGSTVIEAKEQ